MLIEVDLDIMSPIRCITLVNIASLLKTSRYQVKKYMDMLVKHGVAELERTAIYDEFGVMPYCGYKLTDTVKIKSGENIPDQLERTYILQVRAMYQREKERHRKIIEECFGC